jgi:hypothetical protein
MWPESEGRCWALTTLRNLSIVGAMADRFCRYCCSWMSRDTRR